MNLPGSLEVLGRRHADPPIGHRVLSKQGKIVMDVKRLMMIAGEPSGDLLAAELVQAFRQLPLVQALAWPPEFFGAGGPRMAAAGVKLEIDLTAHAVFGLSEALSQYLKFKGFFRRLLRLALERQPDAIILVDFGGFNLRFAKAIKRYVRARSGTFVVWNPKIVYYVSPQVWASRAGRAYQLARNVDLLLSIFPFEKHWYAARVPQLRVEFVGHPVIDRYANEECGLRLGEGPGQGEGDLVAPVVAIVGTEGQRHGASDSHQLTDASAPPLILLLPGSRQREIEAHLPLMAAAVVKLEAGQPLRCRMVLPSAELAELASGLVGSAANLEVQAKGLAESLSEADLAIASSGTVTLECALFQVPTVVVYKTSWLTYEIAKRIVTVKHIAMPNLLAGEMVFPELIQSQVTAEGIARVALDFLNNPAGRAVLRTKLTKVIGSLGGPGASHRAAKALFSLLDSDLKMVRECHLEKNLVFAEQP